MAGIWRVWFYTVYIIELSSVYELFVLFLPSHSHTGYGFSIPCNDMLMLLCAMWLINFLYIQMALNEQLNKFNLQRERCQTTLSSVAAYRSSTLKPKATPVFHQQINAPCTPVKALQPIKFSNDTERLQRINSVRKSHTGAQIKLVIDLLYKVTAKDPTWCNYSYCFQLNNSKINSVVLGCGYTPRGARFESSSSRNWVPIS